MTSQIFLTNQSGIVIASDTMVSWGDRHGRKTLPDCSKISELGSQHQVVVATSGYSGINNLEFSTLIREWGMQLRDPLPTLTDYAASFAEWAKRGVPLFHLDETALAHTYFCRSLSDLNEATNGEFFRQTSTPTKDASADEIKAAESSVTALIKNFDFGSNPQKGSTVEKVKRFLASCSDGEKKFFSHLVDDAEIKWKPSRAFQKTLTELLYKIFLNFVPGSSTTSLNFVGFGAIEPLAGHVEMTVRGYVDGELRITMGSREPEPTDIYAHWYFAAQKGAMEALLEGVDYDELVWTLGVVNEVLSSDFGFTNEQLHALRAKTDEKIVNYFNEAYRDPAQRIVSAAALPGLVRFADALVHVQSLRSVSTLGEATVGGLIEVVGISRTAGVQWHRRLTASLDSGSAHVLV